MKKIYTEQEMQERCDAVSSHYCELWRKEYRVATEARERVAALERQVVSLLLDNDRLKQRMRAQKTKPEKVERWER